MSGHLATLAAGSKSFSFAARFLPAERRADAALLYAFCRWVDDLADEAPDPAEARARLDAVEAQLSAQEPELPQVAELVAMARRVGMDLAHARELVRGVRSDLGVVRVADDRALFRYCYRVAGTVGLMMCPVLGVRAEEALPFAVDLGVAMQLTNICRDVREDALRGRVYLPATRLAAAGVSQDGLLALAPERAGGVERVVQDLLLVAERYYHSAERGLRFIPARPRVAIAVASRVYREIGRRLIARGTPVLAGRTVVSGARKAFVAVGGVLGVLARAVAVAWARPHAAELHLHLAGLPGADVPRLLGRAG
ncbi:MAG: phytoene/squalene synthase family protein [Myxococcales bacterium]|nr:phytoene/squalene synthase family protein [Myxococcales bacterium]MCB9648526.1 phytoene/squalene synthase family protein [Deltaproteobacteria bacterium]